MTSFKIIAVIPTKNEAKNIKKCLNSIVDWVDECIVVDSHSTDGTKDIAESCGAKVISYTQKAAWPKKRQKTFDDIKERSIINEQNVWILNIDADEYFTPESSLEIKQVIATNKIDIIVAKYSMVFLGKLLKYCHAGNKKIIAFRLGYAKYEDLHKSDQSIDYEIHEPLVAIKSARKYLLKSTVTHENSDNIHKFIAKHNTYSDWEAKSLNFKKGNNMKSWEFHLKKYFYKSSLYPLLVFGYFYILRLGFLDGFPGFVYSVTCYLWQPTIVQAKRHEKLLR